MDYKIYITKKCKEDMMLIYEYIVNTLFSREAAVRINKKIISKIEVLKYYPEMYERTTMRTKNKQFYRRIMINNYIILYLINKKSKEIYLVQMVYSGSNYLSSQKLRNL